jgi:hypothetical protein
MEQDLMNTLRQEMNDLSLWPVEDPFRQLSIPIPPNVVLVGSCEFEIPIVNDQHPKYTVTLPAFLSYINYWRGGVAETAWRYKI